MFKLVGFSIVIPSVFREGVEPSRNFSEPFNIHRRGFLGIPIPSEARSSEWIRVNPGVLGHTQRFLGTTWRIIPLSTWLVSTIYEPFRPFGRGTTLLRGLTNHGYSPLTSPGMILQVGSSKTHPSVLQVILITG